MVVIDNYVNVVQAAEALGLHWETVKRMCREGSIPAQKIKNMWLIDKNDLDKCLEYSGINTRNLRELGLKLKRARHQLGLSQAQLAVILGVSNAAVSRWENTNRSPWTRHSKQIFHWLQEFDQN